MKNALLAMSTENEVNIGDYIQQLAAKQFLGEAETFVEREEIDAYDGEEVRMILNGWFMHHPEHWPPSEKIAPLFVSFHMTSEAAPQLMARGSSYFRRHEPIGCRDRATLRALSTAGIRAEFTGCLTLTLGLAYRSATRNGKAYIVDPVLTGGRKGWDASRLRDFFTAIFRRGKMKTLARRMGRKKCSFHTLLRTATFYNEYSAYIDPALLLTAEYPTHAYKKGKEKIWDNAWFMEEAERVVRKYAAAQLVVTSRIHCALPCLGLETPVVYVEHADDSEAGRCRMEGLRELFHTLTWERGRIRHTDLPGGRITPDRIPQNKTAWRPLAEKLAKRCRVFCDGGR